MRAFKSYRNISNLKTKICLYHPYNKRVDARDEYENLMHLFGKLWADKHMLGVAIIQAEAMLMKAWAIAYLYEEQSKIHLRLMTLSHKTKAKPRQNWLSKLKPVTYKLLTDWAIEYSQLKTQ